MFENLGKHLSVISAAVLALSVTYDFFFLHALGLTFYEVPTTITDHLRSAIIWLPLTAIFLFVGTLTGLAQSPHPAAAATEGRRNIDLLDLMLLGTFLLLLVVIAWKSTVTAFLLELGLFGVMIWFRFRFGYANIEAKAGTGTARVLLISLVAILLVASKGYTDAIGAITTPKPTWSVLTKRGDSETQLQLVLVRRFSSVAVLAESREQIQVVPAEIIVTVSPLTKPPTLLRCRIIPSLCDPTP